jgi:hypothetical protein
VKKLPFSSTLLQTAAKLSKEEGKMPFDPDKHQMLPTRHFDDFQIGERFFCPLTHDERGRFYRVSGGKWG